MTDKKLDKLTKDHGTIVRLTEAEKQKAIQNGYKVQEIETPCGAGGYQGVSKPKEETHWEFELAKLPPYNILKK